MCHQLSLLTSDATSDAVSDADLLDRLTRYEREIRQRQAHIARDMAALITRARRDDPKLGEDCAISEIAEALDLHPDTAHGQIEQAVTLVARHPATLDAWQAGRITGLQAAALVNKTACFGDDVAKAQAVEAKVLPGMPGQILRNTYRALGRAVLAIDPEGAEERKQQAANDRHVGLAADDDGMATLFLNTTAEQAVAVYEHVDQIARTQQDPDDERTLAQRRADTMCALILHGQGSLAAPCPPTPAALVQVTVSLETLLGINQEPAELERYGPITAATVRSLAGAPNALWRWLAYDPTTGALIKTAPRVYQPTAEVRRFVQARDRMCTFLGCTRPARLCDLDHTDPFDHEHPERGGATEPDNLGPLCRRHHRIKTAGNFTVRALTPGQSVRWTSRQTGRTYQVQHAHDYRPDSGVTAA